MTSHELDDLYRRCRADPEYWERNCASKGSIGQALSFEMSIRGLKEERQKLDAAISALEKLYRESPAWSFGRATPAGEKPEEPQP